MATRHSKHGEKVKVTKQTRSRSPLTQRSHQPASSSASSLPKWDAASRPSGSSSTRRWEHHPPLPPEAGMDGTLRTMLLDRPTVVAKFLESKGIQTCQDIRYMWSSGKAFLEDVELACGAFPSEQAFQVMVVYTLASSHSSWHHRAMINALVDERMSTIPSRSVTLTEAPEPPKSKLRSVINTCMAERMPNLDFAIDADPEVKEHAKRAVKTQALFEFVLAHLINFQELGMMWAALNDPVKLQSLKDSLMACTSRLSLERIGSLLAAVRRWHRWAVEKGVPPRAPTPLELSEFYRSVATGGPTAAASLFQAMKWFEVNYGAPFHSAHYLIQPRKFNAPSHEGRQQEFINLLVLAARSQGTKLMLVTFLLQPASSCIRFEHFQRSTMVSSFSKWLKFKCGLCRTQDGHCWRCPVTFSAMRLGLRLPFCGPWSC